jgi:precorrin-6B methylase 2
MPGRHVPFFTSAYKPKIGDIVFDIGAGIGTEINDFSSMVGDYGRVIAVEADPIAFRRLSKLVNFYNF